MTIHRESMVMALTIAGGAVDAIMILGFDVLTAAQTGNTILLSVAVARGDVALGMSAGMSALAFVIGAAGGQGLLSVIPARFRIACPLVIEVVLLVFLLGLWVGCPQPVSMGLEWALIGCAAMAMGVQSAVILDLHARSTTYITGMLAGFATGAINGLFHRAKSKSMSNKQSSAASPDAPWRSGVAWMVYALAAVVAGMGFIHFGRFAIALPVLALAWAIFLSLRKDVHNPEGI